MPVSFELRAIDTEEIGQLFGLAARTVLRTIACRPNFPIRVPMRPASWVAGEALSWRAANRAGDRRQ